MGYDNKTVGTGSSAPKVVLYIRESIHKNADEAMQRQRDSLNIFCQSNGYEVHDLICSNDSRQGSWNSFMKAIERAKETKEKTIVMVSTNRIIGTKDDLSAVEAAIEEADVTIRTLDGKFENIKKNKFDSESLIDSFLISIDNEEGTEA